jgi:hypothetical protein
METHGDAYVYYKRVDEKGNKIAYTVATTDFSEATSPYIAKRWAADSYKYKNLPEGTVVFWSWSSNRFRTLPLDNIVRVTSLGAAVNGKR